MYDKKEANSVIADHCYSKVQKLDMLDHESCEDEDEESFADESVSEEQSCANCTVWQKKCRDLLLERRSLRRKVLNK